MNSEMVVCPYHDRWIRLGWEYRACPVCHYCVRCRMLGRPFSWQHSHDRYGYTEVELRRVVA